MEVVGYPRAGEHRAEGTHYAFSNRGPRGNQGIPKKTLNDLRNLMLVCHDCHTLIDQHKDGGHYTVANLQSMKEIHERRITIVGGIAQDKRSHIVHYGANISDHSSPVIYKDTARALLPDFYPAEDRAIELGMVNSSTVDHDAKYWEIEETHLRRLFHQRIKERLDSGEIQHLSVFAIAPQPLLVVFGSLLGDISPAEVYQRHREPPSWTWPEIIIQQPQYEIIAPPQTCGKLVLVLSLSASITAERITAVLGPGVSIWSITIPTPHNDFTKNRYYLIEFRKLIR